MSYKKNIHRAEQAMITLEDKWNLNPNIRQMFKLKGELSYQWKSDCYFPINIAGLIPFSICEHYGLDIKDQSERLFVTNTIPYPEQITAYAYWQRSKHILRFDDFLGTELVSMHLSNDLPVELLNRLPFSCVYIDFPITRTALNLERIKSQGFFVFKTYSATVVDGVTTENVEKLVILYLDDNGDLIPLQISLNHPTIKDIIAGIDHLNNEEHSKDVMVAVKKADNKIHLLTINDICEQHNITFDEYQKKYTGQLSEQLIPIFNLLLYLCADNADIVAVYSTPKPKRIFTKRISKASYHDVGMLIGQQLNRATSYNSEPQWRVDKDLQGKTTLKWIP